ncbi:hypothetical protein M1N13_01890 [Dehalococcoidia bacterium]|nr:hypothetical protein [Dehalococcoidia bacterium]MCL0049031.1 hypothetical protein [Dehalococcoidia bacterium]MCL0056485.1 hypothetical protein [Dehalococcoidia bacterium]MCL0103538.1 hypothetical protein [Dehalococcoidia bacterium]
MIEKITRALERAGMPKGDLYELPASPKTFPDGAHYRVEISGIETTKVLDATIDEAHKQGVPFHRAISLVRGATLFTRDQLREFASIAHEARVEVIITPGPRPPWYTGRQIATPEGALSGMRMRGMDSVRDYLMDIERCIEIGFRGFLVWDEGILSLLNSMKDNGDFPREVIFKVSIFAGHANPAGVKLVESLGADTCNPVADLTLPMLAAIRSVVNIPLDIHIQLWASMGGYNRIYETPEIARVASPCYFKMESGTGMAMYMPWSTSEEGLAELGREKIRSIKNIIELIGETHPELKVSNQGPEDLRVPLPG